MANLKQRLERLSPAQRELLQRRLGSGHHPQMTGAGHRDGQTESASGGQGSAGPAAVLEPIAVVGMACRFPQAANLDQYWDLIRRGGNATDVIDDSRFPVDRLYDPDYDAPGKMVSKWACLLDDLSQFDPKFFGIAPREAARMDPQQRLLLEVAWQAIEHSGILPSTLSETPTSVFMGVSQVDYIKLAGQFDNFLEMIDAHTGTGNSLSISSNRLSYVMNFSGPSATIDTACSSALVAVHQAVASLRAGECRAALAGAVNVCITPDSMISLSRARMVSPTGQCRPFHEDADGYVRGEGAGVVVLKRLSDAVADGDRVLGVIRHTAVNHGGRTSGITAPNGSAQVDVMRRALAGGGIDPSQIGYIEAHGTGTPLGDPIEVEALGEVYRRQSADDPPVYLTSVKANIGHLEIAAGIAGLIKAILVLSKGEIPAQPGLDKLNPRVRTEGTRITIPTEPVSLPKDDSRRLAGVSSFGFGGTNAHAIIESFGGGEESEVDSTPEENQPSKRRLEVLTLSARSDESLKQLAKSYHDLAVNLSEDGIGDLCYTAAVHRMHHNKRAAIRVGSREQVLQDLQRIVDGKKSPTITAGNVLFRGEQRVAFLCTGQGSQYAKMGKTLYEHHPVFRQTMDRCEEVFVEARVDDTGDTSGESLLSVLFGDDEDLIHDTAWTQPALYALEVSLARLWQHFGVQPALLMGHSVGEFAAAAIAGVFSIEDGLRLITRRGELMSALPGGGSMAVVFASAESLQDRLREYDGQVNVAAVNVAAVNGQGNGSGAGNTTVAGDADAVEAFVQSCEKDGLTTQRLSVSHAFHSHHMDPMLDEFEAFASSIEMSMPTIPLVSNLTGQLADETIVTPNYWRQHVRRPVMFADGVATMAGEDVDAMIEIGPAPVLTSMARRCGDGAKSGVPKTSIASLRKGHDDLDAIGNAVAALHVAGGTIDWRAFYRGAACKRIELPSYPFDHQSYWLRAEGGDNERSDDGMGLNIVHPLLGKRVSMAESAVYQSRLRADAVMIRDHVVQGSTLMPGSGYTDMAFAAAKDLYGPGHHSVEDLHFQQALFLGEVSKKVQTVISMGTSDRYPFRIYSQPLGADDDDWELHCTGTIVRDGVDVDSRPEDLDLLSIREDVVRDRSHDEFYKIMSDLNLQYGPMYQVLDGLTKTSDGSIGAMHLNADVVKQLPATTIPPAVGDGAMHAAGGTVPLENDGSFTPYAYLPMLIRRVEVFEPLTEDLVAVGRRVSTETRPSPETVTADVFLTNRHGRCVAVYRGVKLRRLAMAQDQIDQSDPQQWLYRLGWTRSELPAVVDEAVDDAVNEAEGRQTLAVADDALTVVFADQRSVADGLLDKIANKVDTNKSDQGGRIVRVVAGDEYQAPQRDGEDGAVETAVIAVDRAEDYRRLVEDLAIDPSRMLKIVHCYSIDVDNPDDAMADDDGAGAIDRSRAVSAASVTFLYQALSPITFTTHPMILLVTRGGQIVEENAPLNFLQQELIGVGRVATLEFGGFDTRLVDLDPAGDAKDAAEVLHREWATADAETQVAYRGGRRLGSRIEHYGGEAADESGVLQSGRFRLTIGGENTIDALRYRPFQRTPPTGDQVEIRVAATGLNFSDVLKSLGLYPGITDDVVPVGIECAGVVSAVGPEVTRFAVGDEVLGVVPYGFASHCVTAEHGLVKKSDAIDFEEAAVIPIAFMTAYQCLVQVADLQPGEKVLIHAGAGGVGLAAIQIAQDIGAEVFATAGSDVKRDYLRGLGVEHVMSSRDVKFADEIRRITGGRGVDVVLNSLPGDMIDHSLSVLAEYGRFVEIGKVDIYQNKMIGLLPFQANLSYTAVDLDRMFRQRPRQSQALLESVMAKFEDGSYEPPNLTVFDAEQIGDAFRFMSQRRNIGKIAVTMPEMDADEVDVSADSAAETIHGEASYLVTGGLGGLGRRITRWLADQGARSIVLTSRRQPSAEVADELQQLRDQYPGLRITPMSTDVADLASLQSVITRINDELPPLRGVIHAAGVVRQSFIVETDREVYDTVAASKIRGGWNMHLATKHLPLDFFVVFSSVSTIVGTLQQSAYGAANAFLDGLTHHRRSIGLPATSINWGPWAEVGMAAESGSDLDSRGMKSLPATESLDLMLQMVRQDITQATVMITDWPQYIRAYDALRRTGEAPPLFDHFKVDRDDDEAEKAAAAALHGQLIAMSPEDREERLQDYLSDQIAAIMGLEAEDLDRTQSLNTMGLDSLMAIELANKLQMTLQVTLPMSIFIENPSVGSLASASAAAMAGGEKVGV